LNIYKKAGPVYARLERHLEPASWKHWRQTMLRALEGPEVLEVGVGTGANLPYYPRGIRLTAVDSSASMLAKAADRVRQCPCSVQLYHADVEQLPFDANRFDAVVSTCVFCSVSRPRQALLEIRRVLKPGGCLHMIEHVEPQSLLGRLAARAASLVTGPLLGEYFNRRTGELLQEVFGRLEDEYLGQAVFHRYRAFL